MEQPELEFTGRFRLVRKIAEGGMATVYEAEQLGAEGFTKRVALKVIHPRYAKRAAFLRAFIDEAKLSANLMHGNIVQIFQLGEVAGDYFIAMEYIQGPTVRQLIDALAVAVGRFPRRSPRTSRAASAALSTSPTSSSRRTGSGSTSSIAT